MKKTIAILFLTLTYLAVYAQKIDDIVHKPIDDAIKDLEVLMKDEINEEVSLVGIGDVGSLVLESQKLNTRLTAYLVRFRDFRNIMVRVDAWVIRPLDNYLRSSAPLDTLQIDELIQQCLRSNPFLQTYTFRDLLFWLKDYNLANPTDMVGFYGVEATAPIPPAYFLATYIFPIDEAAGSRMSTTWSAPFRSDSQAFQDIEEWLEQLDTEELSAEQKKLLISCRRDMLHNQSIDILKPEYLGQKMPSAQVQDFYHYVADVILSSVDNESETKHIFFGLNANVAKSLVQSDATVDNMPIPTIGKFLHNTLQDRYYVSTVDYSNSIEIPLLNMEKMNMASMTLAGNERLKDMILKQAVYLKRKDKDTLVDFVPTTISFIENQLDILVYDDGVLPVDAVFLFENLSEGKPILR